MLAKLIGALLVAAVATCWMAQVLPALMPYLAALFVMIVAGRVVWFYTSRW